eukprot:3243385-Prymnesium_polylepis.1
MCIRDRHLRLRGPAAQLARAALHQLRQRAAAGTLQRAGLRARAAALRGGGRRRVARRVLGQLGGDRAARREAARHLLAARGAGHARRARHLRDVQGRPLRAPPDAWPEGQGRRRGERLGGLWPPALWLGALHGEALCGRDRVRPGGLPHQEHR